MNQTFQSIRVGLFFVLGIALIYAVYSVIGSRQFGRPEGYRVTATFDNLRTLGPTADVRMAGVRIGEVEKTELMGGRGQVTLRIDQGVQIPSDSVATIAISSLLGQNFVTIRYGTSPEALADGGVIAAEGGPDLNEILAQVQQLGDRLNSIADGFAGFGDANMGELFTNLNALVTENRGRFDTIMANVETLTTKLNSSEGTLGKLINEDGVYTEVMALVTDLRGASEDLDATLAGAKDLIAKVQAGEGTIGRLITDDTIARDLEKTMANMRDFSDKLAAGEGTLGKLVTDDSLYFELKSMLNKADQALDSMGDAGPITAVGALSGALF